MLRKPRDLHRRFLQLVDLLKDAAQGLGVSRTEISTACALRDVLEKLLIDSHGQGLIPQPAANSPTDRCAGLAHRTDADSIDANPHELRRFGRGAWIDSTPIVLTVGHQYHDLALPLNPTQPVGPGRNRRADSRSVVEVTYPQIEHCLLQHGVIHGHRNPRERFAGKRHQPDSIESACTNEGDGLFFGDIETVGGSEVFRQHATGNVDHQYDGNTFSCDLGRLDRALRTGCRNDPRSQSNTAEAGRYLADPPTHRRHCSQLAEVAVLSGRLPGPAAAPPPHGDRQQQHENQRTGEHYSSPSSDADSDSSIVCTIT